MATESTNTGPLAGIRVLDLSRVLAGPWATQMFGDLGADVYKIEQPGVGDDTRRWGPPFLDDGSNDSAYYLCANRNKYSLAIDIATKEGQKVIRSIAAESHILVENFRVGKLKQYGLDYESLQAINPSLVYCSVTGFGQTGPYRDRGGYDFLIQGMSGLMSVTGRPDGQPGAGPLKVGLPVSDLFTGMYSAVSILAALHHACATGVGQHIDCALLDSQVALLVNQASNYMNGGVLPGRLGNEHPNTVPYQDFSTSDGSVLVALGNDRQFRKFCKLLECEYLADDERFVSNATRNNFRSELQAVLGERISKWSASQLIAAMEDQGLPGGRVNTIPEILSDPQVRSRGLQKTLYRSDGTSVEVLGYPAVLTSTPASYRRAPPRVGADTQSVLKEQFGFSESMLGALQEKGVIR